MQLSKKNSKGGPTFGAWHPNFCNTAELPDTKTVRTKFFVNSGCVILAIGALLYWVYTEYNIRNLEAELHNVDLQIQRDRKPSDSAITMYKSFKDEQAKTDEVLALMSANKLLVSDLIISLAKSLPEHVAVTAIQYQTGEVTVKGIIKQAPEVATQTASTFEKSLRESPDFKDKFSNISLVNLNPSAGKEGLTFDIVMKAKK